MLIVLRNVRKVYRMGEVDIPALAGVFLEIERGEFVAVMGASGSGKSTLLNILGCLDRPTSGEYLLDRQDVNRLSPDDLARIRNGKIGFVFQSFSLLPRTSAQENVEIPAFYGPRLSSSARHGRARALLERVGLGDRSQHSPGQLSGGQIVYRDKNWSTMILGVTTAYPEVRNWEMESGAFFTESDLRSGTRVCVLGATVAAELFEGDDPVGATLRVRNMPFRVLGVLKRKGTAAWGQDQDDTVLAPWTTVRRVLQNTSFREVDQILVSLRSLAALPEAREEITLLLRQRHRIAPGDEDDFTVTDMTEVTQMVTQVSRLMTVLLTVIASISLVVGGIGIMNIMLVSVTERTREIGLRMAVGARRRDILLQFLVEAVVLSGIGGVVGTVLGAAAAKVLAGVNRWPVLVSPGSVLLALSFAGGVGVFFGFYPAWRASRLNPIDALRYE